MSRDKFSENDPIIASQIWPVLVWAAINRQTLTYKDLSYLVGIFHRNLSHPLGVIKGYCYENKLPPLTVLVVRKDTGAPAVGLDDVVENFCQAREDVFRHAKNFKNPGIETFKQYAEDWNNKYAN